MIWIALFLALGALVLSVYSLLVANEALHIAIEETKEPPQARTLFDPYKTL